MEKICGDCKAVITASANHLIKTFDYVTCSSMCGRYFHTECANLTEAHMQLLINNQNFLWRCDSCIIISNDSSNKFETLSFQMREMQEKIFSIERKLVDINNANLSNNKHQINKKNQNNKKEIKTTVNIPPPTAASSSIATSSVVNLVEESEQFEDALNDNINNRDVDVNSWVTVRKNKKRNKEKTQQNKKRIVGVNSVNNAFEIVHSMKYLHVSKFKVNTEPEAIKKFVSDKLQVDINMFTCVKLVKKGADLDKLHFVNFKLGVPESLFTKVFDKHLWPLSIKLTRFISKPKNLQVVNDVALTDQITPIAPVQVV